MQDSTITTVSRVVQSDPTATAEQRKAVLDACLRRESRRRIGDKRDAARILKVHPGSIARYAQRGLLHPIRITARKVNFDLDEVEALAQHGADAVRSLAPDEGNMP